METYSFTIKRRFYPGQVAVIPPQLPLDYMSDTKSTVPTGQSCASCYFNNLGYCGYWKSSIKEAYWCGEWRNPLSGSTNLPTPASCLTGFTVPIIITEDFNDIGVYTPFDGLVLQRDVINNFVYTADLLKVTVYNTSDIEFKRFLLFGDYTLDWGDGSNPTVMTPGSPSSHNYGADGIYTITLQQINPWGTTSIKKVISLPYTSQINIPNPFGVVEIHPPNIGDPIACESIYQSYIYSGDSNPDIYDFFSFNYVNVPYVVTGTTTNSRLSLFIPYGSEGLPSTGQTIELVDKLSGEIIEVTSSYTSYTINNIIYTDFLNDDTYFQAYSSGFNPNNLEWECCDENADNPCPCSEFGEVISAGEWDENKSYIVGATVLFNECCWYCNGISPGLSCNDEPTFDSSLWLSCYPCVPPELRKSETVSPPSKDCKVEILLEVETGHTGWGDSSLEVYFDNMFYQTYTVPKNDTSYSTNFTIPHGSIMSVHWIPNTETGYSDKTLGYKILYNGIPIFTNGYPLGKGPVPDLPFCGKCIEEIITEEPCGG